MTTNSNCVKCKQPINPLRLKALPGTRTCVDCSTTGIKKGVPMMFGEKDHTWTDMVILNPEEQDRFEKLSKYHADFSKSELNNDEDDEGKEWDNTLLDGLEEL